MRGVCLRKLIRLLASIQQSAKERRYKAYLGAEPALHLVIERTIALGVALAAADDKPITNKRFLHTALRARENTTTGEE